MNTTPARKILVSGASIAGPALAYWLHRRGFEVTVVEKAPVVRGGGYPIDIRGTAVEVVRRMGIHAQLEDAHVHTRRLSFVGAGGEPIASITPEQMTGGTEGHDFEVPRGDLADILYGAVRDDVEFLFGDSVASYREHDAGVDVTFESGAQRTFDLIAAADGLHSSTRGLAFGPEEQYHRYLGRCFAGFTVPNQHGLSHEGLMWNVPGRGAALYAVGGSELVHAFLIFHRRDAPLDAFRNPQAQRELVASEFAGDGWEIPGMVAAMRDADDLFFDVVSQIHMPSWSKGRVVLVGDAAYAPSFLSGQGTSIALVGAYALAAALADHSDHTAAFAAYERGIADFVAENQALATSGGPGISPGTAEELELRNKALRDPSLLPGAVARAANSSLALPD